MAQIEKRGSAWRARVRKRGLDRTETFRKKAEAVAWATQLEADLAAGRRGEVPDKTFRELVERYKNEVTPSKRGARPEALRLARTMQDELSDVRLPDLNETHVAAWRDRRMEKVGPASTRREWATLSHACNIAIREWKWLRINPFSMVTKPKAAPPRKRRPMGDEITRILHSLGYSEDAPIATKTAAVGAAALFAMETAMRESEIARLRWCDIEGRVAHILQSKSDDEIHVGRDVPLTTEALRILGRLPRAEGDAMSPCFGVTAPSIDALWRKAKAMALVDGLTFHDLRREATTRLAKKVDVLTLAKITGHRDLRILQRVYYAPNMQEVAGMLD